MLKSTFSTLVEMLLDVPKSTSVTLILVALATVAAAASFRLDRVTSVASASGLVIVSVLALSFRFTVTLAFITTSCTFAAVSVAPAPASIETLSTSLFALTVTASADDFTVTSLVTSAAFRVTAPVVSIDIFSFVSVEDIFTPPIVWILRLSKPLFTVNGIVAGGGGVVDVLNLTSDLMFKFSILLTPLIAVSIALISTLSLSLPFFCTVKFNVSLPALPSIVSRGDNVDVFAPLPT